jgi:hypothetical protein
MPRRLRVSLAALALIALTPSSRAADEMWEGFLCCNYRYDGDWMSDSNYTPYPMMPVGTPTRITDYGRYRVYTEMGGKKMRIGNDYSRDLSNVDFAKRVVVKDDPRPKIARFPQRIQQAIAAARLVNGMTKEQVIMSIGYPITSENPSLDAPVWRYWLTSFEEFQVNWDAKGHLQSASGLPTVLARVYDPK